MKALYVNSYRKLPKWFLTITYLFIYLLTEIIACLEKSTIGQNYFNNFEKDNLLIPFTFHSSIKSQAGCEHILQKESSQFFSLEKKGFLLISRLLNRFFPPFRQDDCAAWSDWNFVHPADILFSFVPPSFVLVVSRCMVLSHGQKDRCKTKGHLAGPLVLLSCIERVPSHARSQRHRPSCNSSRSGTLGLAG